MLFTAGLGLRNDAPPNTVQPRVVDGVHLRWAFEQARGGSGAWYAMQLTELLPHVARGLNMNWDEATRYAGLTTEF